MFLIVVVVFIIIVFEATPGSHRLVLWLRSVSSPQGFRLKVACCANQWLCGDLYGNCNVIDKQKYKNTSTRPATYSEWISKVISLYATQKLCSFVGTGERLFKICSVVSEITCLLLPINKLTYLQTLHLYNIISVVFIYLAKVHENTRGTENLITS